MNAALQHSFVWSNEFNITATFLVQKGPCDWGNSAENEQISLQEYQLYWSI